jgi:putative ABC transport system permease protein
VSKLNLFRFIGLRHLLSKPLRTSLTVFGMALGIGLSVAIQLINSATLQSFSETITSLSGEADLSITAGELGFPENQLERIENTSGVAHAVPVIEEHAYLIRNGHTETLFILGVDMLRESAVRTYKDSSQQVMDDPQIFLNQPDSMVVSETFAKKHGLKIDSGVDLTTATGSRHFTIRGIMAVEGAGKAYGGDIALMDIDGARVTFGKEGKMDRVDVVLKSSANADTVSAALKQELGSGYKVERPGERAENMAQMISSFQSMLRLIGILSVVIGLMLVGNAMKIAISERRREIGILRSLGTSKGSILLMFLSEAIVLGLIGAALGSVFGFFMAHQLVDLVSNSLSTEMLMRFQTPQLHFTGMDVVRALGLGVVAAVVSSLRPSRNAAQVPPVEAMAIRPPTMNEASVKKVVWRMAIAGVLIMATLTLSSYMQWNLKNTVIQFLHQVAGPPALILLTPLMTYWLAVTFSAVARKFGFDIVGRLAQDNLRREPGRAANNILTLGLGLYLVVVVSSINSSFKRSIGDWADRYLAADLVISSIGRLGTMQTQPLNHSLKEKLESIPEVAQTLSGSISGMRFIHTEYGGRTIAIKAYDDPPAGEGPSKAYRFDVIDGDRDDVTRRIFSGPEVAISKNMATRFGLHSGDTLHLQTPSGPLDLHVAAQVNDFASHEGVIYMARRFLTQYWHDDLVNGFFMNLKPGTDATRVKTAIDNALGMQSGLMVKFNSDLKAEIMDSIDQSFAYTKAIELASLLSGLLGMLNMMIISVLERTREIGLLRSVGMSKSQVFRTIFTESITQGVIAGLIATTVGLYLSFLWVRFSLSNVIGWSVDFHIPSNIVFVSVALGVCVSGFAGLIPAYRAARLEIKESLSYE